jgi:hypothetical protein
MCSCILLQKEIKLDIIIRHHSLQIQVGWGIWGEYNIHTYHLLRLDTNI